MGFALEISKDDKTVFKANFGMKDLARNLTVDNNTMFRMASLSKSMTASGLMILIN
jgi:CubicO group peptidase (beta-lactamase class C family)